MAINVISFQCPKCGANLSVEEGKNKYYCSYCGASIIIDDGVERKEETYHVNINKNTTIHKVDEAALRKAIYEGDLSRQKYLDEVAEKERKRQEKIVNRKKEIRIGTILLVFGVMSMILVRGIIRPSDPNSDWHMISVVGLLAGIWGIGFLFPRQNDD